MPGRAIQCYVEMADARRDIERVWTEYRDDPQVLGKVLDHDQALGERIRKRRIDDDLRGRLIRLERYNGCRPKVVPRALRRCCTRESRTGDQGHDCAPHEHFHRREIFRSRKSRISGKTSSALSSSTKWPVSNR